MVSYTTQSLDSHPFLPDKFKPQKILFAVESNLGNESGWIAHSLSAIVNVVSVRDEKGRIGLKTSNKMQMATRSQQLLASSSAVAFSTPFVVGTEEYHVDRDRTPESRIKHMLKQQLLQMRIVSTMKANSSVASTFKVTISGKVGEGNTTNARTNDDVAMSFICAVHWYQKYKSGQLEAPVRARFRP